MEITTTPLIAFLLSFVFFLVACDPKSKYGFFGIAFMLFGAFAAFWPKLAPVLHAGG